MKRHIFLLMLALIIPGCLQQPEKTQGPRYYEIVYQDDECLEGTCFSEYIVLEDGFVFIKERQASGDYEVRFCQADEKKHLQAFQYLETKLTKNTYENCDNCKNYHLYYNNGTSSRHSNIPSDKAQIETEIYHMTQDICSEERDGSIIHIIWGDGTAFLSYHFFPNDYSVLAVYGAEPGKLITSEVQKLKEGQYQKMWGVVDDGAFEETEWFNCPKNGLTYGYLEISDGKRHQHHFTCGGEDPAGKTFDELKKMIEGRN